MSLTKYKFDLWPRCKKCGLSNSDGWNYCPDCGKKVTKK